MIYVLVGGFVTSRNDEQRHFISARRLVDLYSLPLGGCVLCSDESQLRFKTMGMKGEFVTLRPDPSGRYDLPARR